MCWFFANEPRWIISHTGSANLCSCNLSPTPVDPLAQHVVQVFLRSVAELLRAMGHIAETLHDPCAWRAQGQRNMDLAIHQFVGARTA